MSQENVADQEDRARQYREAVGAYLAWLASDPDGGPKASTSNTNPPSCRSSALDEKQ
jgi:hypothetical protein